MGITADAFIGARWFHPGRARKVRLVVIHATQSPERKGAARGVARDFATRPSTKKASAHVVVDNAETIECVHPGDTAFAAPNANADGWHVEQVGYSEQAGDDPNPGVNDWADDYSQDVIARAAVAVREGCEHFGIPKVWLDVDDVKAGKAGVTSHAICSKALGGTHWDPGPGYPSAQLMGLVNGTAPDPDPTPDDEELILL